MEEIDINELLLNFEMPEMPSVVFMAAYNPSTGEILSVGPKEAFIDVDDKFEIDADTAENIISGRMRLSACSVNLELNELVIVETINVSKIDDVLHRISLQKWTENDAPEIFITYYAESEKLKFQLSELYFGTKKLKKKYQPVTPKLPRWPGDTELLFMVTAYNDPHEIYEVVKVTINELKGRSKTFNDINLPDKFSIFTRRVFKNYIMDVK